MRRKYFPLLIIILLLSSSAFPVLGATNDNEMTAILNAANDGDADSQFNLGVMYQVKKDYNEAIKWFRLAAEQGHAGGEYKMGVMYNYGYGVSKNYDEALKWYRKAVQKDYVLAKTNIGTMYSYGYGVEKNIDEAVKWYRLAAEQGEVIAQCNLGLLYLNGKEVNQDYQEALKWLLLSADPYNFSNMHATKRDSNGNVIDHGYAKAQLVLGQMYASGKGVKRDQEEAIKWFTLAAEQGHAEAQFQLGRMLRDVDESKKWIHKAAEQGHTNAQSYEISFENVKYRDVARNPYRYEGKHIKFSGEVIQVLEDGLDITLRIAQDNSQKNFSDIWLASYTRIKSESRILEDDYIQVYGECIGVTTYESTQGKKVTVPHIIVLHYKILN